MENILEIAETYQKQAWRVIEQSGIIKIWEQAGAEINLIGSLKTGLLIKHRDIDFHIYTSQLSVSESFKIMAEIAANPHITRIEYTNLLEEDDKCLEWHAWFKDDEQNLWQIDMMHILKGSKYEGFFESFCEKLTAVITQKQKEIILRLKYLTPPEMKIPGIEYYQAVIDGNVGNWPEFEEWRCRNPLRGINEWCPL